MTSDRETELSAERTQR